MTRNETINAIRNIGIIAHIDAGKTTVTERILYDTGRIHKTGETHDGASQMDWMELERERGITITSAATTTYWKGTRINIIDTPGHVDFTAEVVRSLRVLDGSVIVIDAQSGVEPQTETVWRQASRYHVPCIAFVNKMDKTGADFGHALTTLRDKLDSNMHPIQIPMCSEHAWEGIIDLISMTAWYDSEQKDDMPIQGPIPANYRAVASKQRDELLETLALHDNMLLEHYLNGADIAADEIIRALRAATIQAKVFPVLCGSALNNRGIALLLDAITQYLPSPADIKPAVGCIPETNRKTERAPDEQEPFSAIVFKVMNDKVYGRLTFFRVYSGSLCSGDECFNAAKGRKERLGRILQVHANTRKPVEAVFAGDIAAYMGHKDTTTGDSLCDEKHPIVFETMEFPDPVVHVAMHAPTLLEEDKLSKAVRKIAQEDPTLRVTRDEAGALIVSGMGELHIETVTDRVHREFGLQANTGEMQVAYRETFPKAVTADGRYIRQSGGAGQYGHVVMEFVPLERGAGIHFENVVSPSIIPPNFVAAAELGVREALRKGIAVPAPMIDTLVRLVGGSSHPVDGSKIAFQIAASKALQEAAQRVNPYVLEPIMQCEIVVPSEYLGEILRQIAMRRGSVLGTTVRGANQLVQALVPFSQMLGYATDLRSATHGYGTYTMEFLRYDVLPTRLQMELIEKNAKIRLERRL